MNGAREELRAKCGVDRERVERYMFLVLEVMYTPSFMPSDTLAACQLLPPGILKLTVTVNAASVGLLLRVS